MSRFTRACALFSAALLGITSIAAAVVVTDSAAASADESGSVLVTEDFTGSSVADARWLPLGAACLTGATSAPASGESTIGMCTHTRDTSDLTGQANGFLQLTDNSGNQSGSVLFNRAIPSRAGLDISFYQYQYSTMSTGIGGADGIGFFLTDGAHTLSKVGPTGGSLGYGSIGSDNGIANALLGIGLDVFGNFSSQPYVGTQCTETHPRTQNAVVIRDGAAANYCIAQSSSTDSGRAVAANQKLTTSAPVAGSADEANNGRLVRIVISPTTDSDTLPDVTVYIDGVETLATTLQTPLSPTVKFGFSASTGSGYQAHLIRTVTVSTVESLGAISVVKSVDRSDATGTQATSFSVGDRVPYSFLVTNTGLAALKEIVIDDPLISDVQCEATSLKPADSVVCTGTYTITDSSPLADGTLTNTATVTAQTDDVPGETVTDDSSVTVPVVDGSVTWQKVDGADGEMLLPGSEWSLHREATDISDAGDWTVVDNGENDADPRDGVLSLTALPLGDYTLTETTAPTGYLLADEPAEFTIGAAESARTVDLGGIENDRLPGSVTWLKTDATTGDLLGGAVFELTGPGEAIEVADNTGQAGYTGRDTDPEAGSFAVDGLEWGAYSANETTAPAGYVLSDATVSFPEITAQNRDVTALAEFANTRETGSVSWTKVDGGGSALAGSGWTLTGPSGFTETFVDNDAHAWQADGLAWGAYTLTETTVPIGYSGAEPIVFTVDAAQRTFDLGAVANTQRLGSVSWTKTDAESGAPLGGATFALTGPDDEVVSVVDNTGEEGYDGLDTDPAAGAFTVEGLAWGSHLLTETAAPAGHLLADDAGTAFEVDAEHLTLVLDAIPNTRMDSGLAIAKSSDPASGSTVARGDTVTYTVRGENTGNVVLTPVDLQDDLSDVLDDATYVDGSAVATVDGSSEVAPPVVDLDAEKLSWSGSLEPGQVVAVTYAVRVDETASDAATLANLVTGAGSVPDGAAPPITDCGADGADCRTENTVVVPTPTPEPTETSTPTPEPVASESPTPEPSPTASGSPIPTPTSTETSTPTPSPSVSGSPTPSSTVPASPTPAPTTSPEPEPSASASPEPSPSSTASGPHPIPSATPSPSGVVSPEPTPSPSATAATPVSPSSAPSPSASPSEATAPPVASPPVIPTASDSAPATDAPDPGGLTATGNPLSAGLVVGLATLLVLAGAVLVVLRPRDNRRRP